MEISTRQFQNLLQAKSSERLSEEKRDWLIEIDSRHITDPTKTIFFALKGTHTHGNKFIPELIKKGVRLFVTDQHFETDGNAEIFIVQNSVTALQQLANAHRIKFQIPVIGITGSNGKTLVKEWLGQMLANYYSVCKNPRSYNSQIGVALSVIELKPHHNVAIFEAGISQIGEMAHLQKMILPSLGILTNIGDAHDLGFSSVEEKIFEKIKLFEHSEYFYYPGDNTQCSKYLKNVKNAISWGTSQDSIIKINYTGNNDRTTHLSLTHKQKSFSFHLPFDDAASLENIVPCILISIDLGIPDVEIQEIISRLHGIKLRLEQKEGINDCILINDSYSLDLKSLQLSLQFLNRQDQIRDRVLIISDFVQQTDEDNLYERLAYYIREYKFKIVIAVGVKITALSEYFDDNITFYNFTNTEDLKNNLDQFHFKNQIILFKGARIFRLEKIFNELSASRHESILEINLKSIAHNIGIYRKYLNPKTELIAVVKASAYGTGNFEIAKYLEGLGINILAVAYQDEAILLREKGIQGRIIVLNSGLADYETLIENNIEPAIFSIHQFHNLVSQIGSSPVRIHLKLDTGMHRLGFSEQDLTELMILLKSYPQVKVESIFSHLSGSDNKQFDDFSNIQFKLFQSMYNKIIEVLPNKPPRHILNSGGISRWKNFEMEMIRLGIGMYGIDSNPLVNQQLEKVHRLKTRITQIKHVKKGDFISYNQSGKMEHDGKIAVLSLGYADGLPRAAGLSAYKVWISDRFCNLIGVVCMDMCMVDITSLEQVNEGDEVEVFGIHSKIEQLAMDSSRIPYEIICGISSRVKRVYIDE